jgi:2-isopropylmalate synthase
MSERTIRIFDTTLRDGEQCPGASMNAAEKLQVAHQLARLRVDIIEAGFPYSSPGDFESVQQIAREVKGPVICGLVHARLEAIDVTAEAIKPAERRRIHTFLATSDIHLQYKLRKTREEVLEMVRASVNRARQYTDDVEYSAEDASRTDLDYLCRVVETAITAGASTINLPDTVGYAVPEEHAAMFRAVMERVPGSENVIFSCHCHDDLGMAVANSLAAVGAGVGQIECTINGIGERAGNTALEEVVMALHTRHNALQAHTEIDTREIYKTSRLIRDITGFPVPPNKAIVGGNAFAHASGIHQDGMLKHQQTYEIMTPESIGLDSNRLVLTSRSGRHAFRARMASLGYTLSDEDLNDAYKRFLEVADKKKEVFDADLEALMLDRAGEHLPEDFVLESLTVTSSLGGVPAAAVRLRHRGELVTEVGTGVGSVDSVYKTIDKMVEADYQLTDYIVSAVTGGTDALAEVLVRMTSGDRVFTGRAADLDIVVASANAYLQAINKIVAFQIRRGRDGRALTPQSLAA